MTLITFNKTNNSLIDRYDNILTHYANYPFKYDIDSNNRLDVEIIEKEKNIDILANLPGIEKKDININIHNNVMEISTENSKVDSHHNDKFFHYNERSKDRYHRTFKLTENIDKDSIKAKFKNGELIIQLPKMKEVVSVNKKITIN